MKQTVKSALKDFYRANYFGEEAFTAKWAHIKIGPFSLPFPNPAPRREAVHLHDISHLVIGYDTSWAGEGELAAWELASGFGPHWIGYFYAPFTFSVGLAVAPRRVARAMKRGCGSANPYKLGLSRKEIEAMMVDELKAELKL